MAALTGLGISNGTSDASIHKTNRYAALTVTDIEFPSTEEAAEQDPDATNGNEFRNGTQRKVFMVVRNSGGTERDLTIQIPGEVDTGVENTDRVVPVPAGETHFIPALAPHIYNWGGTDLVRILAEHTDLKLTLYRLT